MTDEDFAGAEWVPVWAAGRRVGDPLPGRGLYQLAQHDCKPIPPKRAKLRPGHLSDIGQRPSGGVPRGEGPPFYLACRVFTGLWRAGVE